MFELAGKKNVKKSYFQCQRDCLKIGGTEYRRATNEKLPIAIVCHEFMAWQGTVKKYAVLLAELGYAAYCFDFNGGSFIRNKSDGKTTDMSVLTEVKDLEAVIEYVRTLPYVDKDRIFLMGCSQGGLVSALVAAKNKYLIEKLCLFYPALSIPDDARAGKMILAKYDPKNVPNILRCGPMKLGRCYPMDVMNMNVFEEISSYNGKVCIVHGTADNIVNINYSQKAVAVYRKVLLHGMNAETRAQLYIIDGGTHIFLPKHDKIAKEKLKLFAKL